MVKEHWTVEQIQSWYLKEILDPQIGKIRDFLEEKKLFDNTIFFFVADHGQTKITEYIDENSFLRAFPDQFRIAGRGCSINEADLVIMPGAGTKDIYVKNRSKPDWMSPPRLLEDVKSALDALITIDDMGMSLNALLVGRYPGERDATRNTSDEFWYFDMGAYLGSKRHDGDFWAALNPLSSLDTLVGNDLRASHMYNLDFSRDSKPDFVLINKPGHYFTPDEGKYAHHGSIYGDDAFVSFVVSGPAIHLFSTRSRTVPEQINTVDLVPMAAYLAGIKIDRSIDGVNRLIEVK